MPTPTVNAFFWYDVMTTDTEAATKFYTDVVGWTPQDSGSPGYTALTVDGVGTAGLMAVPEDAAKMGARPCWMGYILVDDVAAKCEAIRQEGGTVHKGPVTIEGIITFAVVGDPQGGGFLIAKPIPDKPVNWPAPGTPGTVGWHELMAGDWEQVWPFYEKLFGWKKSMAMDMGPMGVYQIFSAGGPDIGAMMTKPQENLSPMPYWNYYINVASVTAAVDKINAHGGQVLMGPMEVPGGQYIVQALDPQGALFCLVSSGK
jgi:predicted enzyme related to lactoylglutathione lyase